jgi:hypothetical protein
MERGKRSENLNHRRSLPDNPVNGAEMPTRCSSGLRIVGDSAGYLLKCFGNKFTGDK